MELQVGGGTGYVGGSDDGSASWDSGSDSTPTESQESDPVTYEDVADPEDLDTDANRAAVSDDPNTTDTVDDTTTVNTDVDDDGETETVTNTGDSDTPEWSEVPSTGSEGENQSGGASDALDALPVDLGSLSTTEKAAGGVALLVLGAAVMEGR